MQVFLSWSGERSMRVAELLREWLGCVVQAAKPWLSSRDISPGSIWFGEVSNQLSDTSVGIICLTKENRENPWILFEAGALAKGLASSRVMTLLIDLNPADIRDPLAQFNHTSCNEDGVKKIVHVINSSLGSLGLDGKTLNDVLGVYIPIFQQKFSEIIESTPDGPAEIPIKGDDLVMEVLSEVRRLGRRVSGMENRWSVRGRIETEEGSSLRERADYALKHRKPLVVRLQAPDGKHLNDVTVEPDELPSFIDYISKEVIEVRDESA